MEKINREAKFYIHDKFGEVPIGWEIKTLDECFNFFPNASYSRANLTEVGDCYYVHYGDIHTKFNIFLDFEKHELPFVTQEMAKRFKKLKDGDLIMADASEDYDGVGKAVEVVNIKDKEAIAGLHTLHLRCKNDCFVKGFAGYILNNEKVRHSILSSATGIKVYSVSKTGLKKILLPRPPKSEQTGIASILSKVDEVIASTDRSIQALEKLKKSMMQNLFSGKLKPDGTWRKESEFYIDDKFGKLPLGWEVSKLIKVVNKITDGEHLSPEVTESGEFLISAEDVFDDGIHLETAKFVSREDCLKFRKRCNPEIDDILIVSRGAGVGRTCKVNIKSLFCMMGSVILIKPKADILINDFISLYLKTYQAWKELRRLSGSSAQQAIYLAHLKNMRIIFPTDTIEQEAISNKILKVDVLIFQKKSKITTLQRLKKSLMQNLLTGKVRLKSEFINGHKALLTEIPNLQPA